jgi:hypothetical protein
MAGKPQLAQLITALGRRRSSAIAHEDGDF